jgi:tetratricopeptide (TPR) repeat protein
MNRFCRTAVAAACASVVGISSAHGQESLQQVKVLYASAAYEDALSMVGRLQATSRKPEVEQYRVYCLVALGRTAEAEKAIASVVVENPTFLPDAGETSPRIQEMFLRIRRALVPEIAQRMYMDARAAWNRKDTSAASSQFASLIELIDTAAGADANSASESAEPMLSELRLLAAGFLDLSRALSSSFARVVEPVPSLPRAPMASAAPQITSAVPVKQDLPVWVPPDPATRREFRGAIRVFINEAGAVTQAEVSQVVHPAYDRQLLLAAKTWTYQPALKDGVPIASEKVIEVVLKPR